MGHSEKGKTTDKVEGSAMPGPGEGRVEGEAQRVFQGRKMVLSDTVIVDTGHCTRVQTHRMRWSPNVNHRLWAVANEDSSLSGRLMMGDAV